MRRIILHAGFHKTGTTSLQNTLHANRGALQPDVRLILRAGMTALCEACRGYSRSRSDLDLGLVKYEAALLAEQLQKDKAQTIFITSEDLSGHMPGRHGLRSYAAAPHLMRALAIAFTAAAPADQIIFFFTTRDADDWLHSSYVQHLKASRMVLDEEQYATRFRNAAAFGDVLDQIGAEVPGHAVVHAALEQHPPGPFGPAGAALDVMGVSGARRERLVPASGPANIGLAPALKAELLALNRSDLSQSDLKTAKRALLKEAA